MINEEYILSFYSIFVGVAASSIVINWARILKNFPFEKIEWSQYVWSVSFFLLIIWEWFIKSDYNQIDSPFKLFLSLVNPLLIFFISYLILPQFDIDSTFDVQKKKISILAIMWLVNKYIVNRPYLTEYSNTRVELLLLIFIYIILFFDKRKVVWNIASVVFSVFLFSFFTKNIFSHHSLILYLLFVLLCYFTILFFGGFKKRKRG